MRRTRFSEPKPGLRGEVLVRYYNKLPSVSTWLPNLAVASTSFLSFRLDTWISIKCFKHRSKQLTLSIPIPTLHSYYYILLLYPNSQNRPSFFLLLVIKSYCFCFRNYSLIWPLSIHTATTLVSDPYLLSRLL